MKMRKLLATAVAASLAVTSLATVASAAEKSWNMGHTSGTVKYAGSAGIELGDKYYLDDEEFKTGANTLGITSSDTLYIKDTTGSFSAVKLMVTGVKGSRGAASKTYTYNFKNYKRNTLKKGEFVKDVIDTSKVGYIAVDADTDFSWIEYPDGTYQYGALEDGATFLTEEAGDIWRLDVYANSAPLDAFLPEQFLEITKMEVGIEGSKTTTDGKLFDDGGWNYGQWINYNSFELYVDFAADDSDLLNEIAGLVVNLHAPDNQWGFNAKATDTSTKVDYPFMPVTNIPNEKGEIDDKLGREEIRVLSVTNAWSSTDRNQGNDNSNQSYEGENTVDGEVKKDFAGLASQAADFFNKQTNGTITFKFTTATEAGGTAWENGGIPSTQTGIKNFMGDATANDFALFINYKQTGSLQAIVELDKDAGTVTFDISDILDAMGGQTLGVIDNIYYGLRKGIEYKDIGEGLMVETVTFAYDEDADVEADIEDDVEDDADVEIEEDDDVEIEDDADDAEEDDADTAGDVVVEEEDDDANPGTGVALAVVPAMVAAAAVVLSKKRK